MYILSNCNLYIDSGEGHIYKKRRFTLAWTQNFWRRRSVRQLNFVGGDSATKNPAAAVRLAQCRSLLTTRSSQMNAEAAIDVDPKY